MIVFDYLNNKIC